eukprot:3022460-Rhodomonas_salina.2
MLLTQPKGWQLPRTFRTADDCRLAVLGWSSHVKYPEYVPAPCHSHAVRHELTNRRTVLAELTLLPFVTRYPESECICSQQAPSVRQVFIQCMIRDEMKRRLASAPEWHT